VEKCENQTRIQIGVDTLMSAKEGYKGERFVTRQLRYRDLVVVTRDDWIDLEVFSRRNNNPPQKLEVRTCTLGIKNGHVDNGTEPKFLTGRYDMRANQERHRQEDVWYCFVLNVKGRFQNLGFTRATRIPQASYLSLKNVLWNDDLIDVNKFCGKIRHGG